MTDASGQSPPGWYEVASQPGMERFWDGTRWTSAVKATPVPPTVARPIKRMLFIPAVVTAGAIASAMLPLALWTYTPLRWVIVVGAMTCLLLVLVNTPRSWGWGIGLVPTAALWNPFLPVYLPAGRELWLILDVLGVAFMVVVAVKATDRNALRSLHWIYAVILALIAAYLLSVWLPGLAREPLPSCEDVSNEEYVPCYDPYREELPDRFLG